MAMNIAGIGGTVLGWFSSLFFWVFVLIILLAVGFGFMWVRKKRALLFPAFELSFLTSGKPVVEQTTAGWFGKNSAFLGLITYGQKIMKLKDGRKVQSFSTDDYYEYRKNNKMKRCIYVTTHPEDKTVVIPITKSSLDKKNMELVYEVAPADYRDSAVEAFNETTKEMRGSMERVLPYVILGGIVVFFIVGIIINGQVMTRSVDAAQSILGDAGDRLEKLGNILISRTGGSP